MFNIYIFFFPKSTRIRVGVIRKPQPNSTRNSTIFRCGLDSKKIRRNNQVLEVAVVNQEGLVILTRDAFLVAHLGGSNTIEQKKRIISNL